MTYYDEDNSWAIELEEFVSCIQKNQPVQVGSCLEAYKTMVLIEEIYASDEQWNSVAPQRSKNYEDSSLIK